MYSKKTLAISGFAMFSLLAVLPLPGVLANETVTLDYALGPVGLGARADGYTTKADSLACPSNERPNSATTSAYYEFSNDYEHWSTSAYDDIYGDWVWYHACIYDGDTRKDQASGFGNVYLHGWADTVVFYMPPAAVDDELQLGAASVGRVTVTASY